MSSSASPSASTFCPSNSISFNGSRCACPPGYLLDRTANGCRLFNGSSAILTDTVVDDYYTASFPATMLSFDAIKTFTQSQAVFLEATVVLLLSWLVFCFFLRFVKLGDGGSIWFKLRWWISRLDFCFATRHWLNDQKVVVKRKTELGGAFSIASWILFIGLFAASLYQIIWKRTIEVHNLRATNAPDLDTFSNDMEFNITTISSMSCANLRGLGNIVTGNPGSIDYQIANLTDFVNYTCWNTSIGPLLSFTCSNCQLNRDRVYISWQFVDIPDNPAAAVGFQFNLTARNSADKKRMSFVCGTLKNGSALDDTPVTFRGSGVNILKFNLFPWIYRNLHDLRLIQPLFHDFFPGSFFRQTAQLQASLGTPSDGVINTTLYINYLSDYVVEIENENIMGPVSFLADLGGLYCMSVGIFLYFLVQCEYRIKKLRNEDSVMRNIRSRLKAQERWNKLRKYVMYTWDWSTLDDDYKSTERERSCGSFMVPSVHLSISARRYGSSRKRRSWNSTDTIAFNRKVSLRSEKPLKSEALGPASDGKQCSVDLCEGNVCQTQAYSLTGDNVIGLPPPPEFKIRAELDVSDIQKNFQCLYDYNVMLRNKLIATESLLHSLASKFSCSLAES